MDGRGSFSVVSLSEYFAFLSCPNVSLVTEVTVHQASTTVCSVVIFLYNSSKPYYFAEEWITSRAIKSARKEGRQGQTKHNTRSSKIILRLWRLLLLLFPFERPKMDRISEKLLPKSHFDPISRPCYTRTLK